MNVTIHEVRKMMDYFLILTYTISDLNGGSSMNGYEETRRL